MERAAWIYSTAVLQAAVSNETVRKSSVVVLRGFSVVQQDAYGLFGFATAFGNLTRLVTHQRPKNQQFFTPVEMGRMLWRTDGPPNNFNRIRPGGQQSSSRPAESRPGARGRSCPATCGCATSGRRGRWTPISPRWSAVNTTLLKPATPFSHPRTSPQARPTPGSRRRDFTNGLGMRMVRQPGGWWAGALETTQDAYERLMASNPSLFTDPSRPVERVSWLEAMEFCRRLTAMESEAGRLPAGFVYRLPTTKEFDAYAGTLSDPAITSMRFTRWQTEPAGSLPPNQFGLHDTFGNVWEWCLDWGDADPPFQGCRRAARG